MKHLLPILTLALLGVATTASADFYYDYYKDAVVSPNVTPVKDYTYNAWWPETAYTDTITYKDFEVARTSNWNVTEMNNSNFYRIHVLGEKGTKINLYLTDFVDNAGSDNNQSALINNLSAYGYRTLTLVDGKYVPTGDTQIINLTGDDAVSPTVKDSVSITKEHYDELGSELVDGGSYTVTRYQYSLGSFDPDTVIEVYMKDLNGGEAYSYSGINEAVYADDGINYTRVGADGAFGDGGYRVNLETDEMLNSYYYQDENLKAAATAAGMSPEKVAQIGFGEDETARAAASAKSMPLSALDPSGTRVYFGIIASVAGSTDTGTSTGTGAVGSPLPGGFQIALIAGLFGLGFWYIRRRKASVA